MDKKGRKFLSDLKLYSDYLGWNDLADRYETWEEAVDEVFDTHAYKYPDKIEKLEPYVNFAKKKYKEKIFLASQRNLQFRGNDIFKHEFRMYNCITMYADKISFLGNAFYLLLCGCGVGVNMMNPFIERIPTVVKRNKGIKSFTIKDSIEGWAEAEHILINSYLYEGVSDKFKEYQGYEIKFDYSQIREKGAKVGRRFKAPGSDGIRNAFEKIEKLLNSYVEDFPKEFKAILLYDVFMHLADAVLSGGVRRSACSIIISPENKDMIFAKSGNWRKENRQRERSNNSVGLIKGSFTKEEFLELLKINEGTSDIGFVFLNNIFEIYNPCFEIGFTPLCFGYDNKNIINRIMSSDITILDEGVTTGVQACNLNEINGAILKNPNDLYEACRAAAITGTLQAGYTNFNHLEDCLEESIIITKKEALLGVSIAGWTNSPWLFNEEILKNAAKIVLDTNKEVADILGINSTARGTTVKPGGNGPVVLMCASGVTPEHSKNYFRVMQLNKETETAKYIQKSMPYLIEESVYSEGNTDYVVYVPIENPKGTIYKSDLQGVEHLKKIKLIMNSWIKEGKNEENCIVPSTSHNVSNTIIIDNYNDITNYIFDNQDSFSAVSFMSVFGDKDYNQAPNTSVLSFEEIYIKYGEGSLFASGLIVDGLHAFKDNLWEACECILHRDREIHGHRTDVFIKKDWIKRAKKFAKNYFKGDINFMIYCLKDVHLRHKWNLVNREFKEVDFTKILNKPEYKNMDEMGAMACSGNSCEIVRI